MNADAFRHFYNYHFAENRKIWKHVASLTHAQFTQEIGYSKGSIREQVIHLIDAETMWFSELRGVQPPEPIPPTEHDDRETIHTYWDNEKQNIRAYLATLTDDMLFTKPIEEPEEDQVLITWQVLLHVANHATDHRAQILRALNDFGVKTIYQDYIFYVYENLM